MIEQYMAVALQPAFKGVLKREDCKVNLEHISSLIDATIWMAETELPVKLVAIPEGAIQGFTDEVFDMEHEKFWNEIAIDLPGEESDKLGEKAKQYNTYIVAQARVKDPDFPKRYFNCGFIIDPKGKVVYKRYKMQVYYKEPSTMPSDVWDMWVKKRGATLDSLFPVADTEIGKIGCLICYEGSFPETARGLAMNGAEIIYRCSYAEPWVGIGWWEIQNRARALDNSCYVIAPNIGAYYVLPDAPMPIDVPGGKSMIVDYRGQVIARHDPTGGSAYTGAIIDIEALRRYRSKALLGTWLKEMRMEQYRPIYEKDIFPKNLFLKEPRRNHAQTAEIYRKQIKKMFELGIWTPPTEERPGKN